ncbi:MAG: hypothetical protein GF329_01910 [Candidatus Lokiarchaeota archaeon]|nr:hypothetical protein [Candidatus Lokiarchaeota archaeon]
MERQSLRELTDFYFKRNHNNKIDYDHYVDKKHKFDIIITQKDRDNNNDKKIGVFVCDIHRSIGLNVLRKTQQMLEDSNEITDAVLVGKNFSSQVRKFKESYDVKLLSRSQIRRNLESKWDY